MDSFICSLFDRLNISVNERQKEQFEIYYDFLIEYNKKINLTAITDKREVYIKHFIDSIYLLEYMDLEENIKIADVGTGAGFPSVPLKIMRPSIDLTLIDSLKKRLIFLNQLMLKLNLEADIIHQRAEDIGKNQRESFDIVVSRAVANLRVLSEYDLPYVKKDGLFIAYKGPDADSEIKDSETAIETLGGRIEKKINFNLIDEGERNLIFIRKNKSTPDIYPRNSKKILNKPI